MGSLDKVHQEFGNVFLGTGTESIDIKTLENLKKKTKPPQVILEDGAYQIWEQPNPDRFYVEGIDTGEGVGKNASCIQIIGVTDLTNITQVAIYWTNTMDPYNFKTKANTILTQWGCPPAAIERNSCGAQVVDGLVQDFHYPRIITFLPKHLKTKSKQFLNSSLLTSFVSKSN